MDQDERVSGGSKKPLGRPKPSVHGAANGEIDAKAQQQVHLAAGTSAF